MTKDKLYYITSPYSNPDPAVRQARYDAVRDFCAKLAGQGYHVYSPILHWHPAALANDMPTDAAFWLDQNNASLDHSDALIAFCLDGFSRSVGAQGELQRAWDRRMEIEYYDCYGFFSHTITPERRSGLDRRHG